MNCVIEGLFYKMKNSYDPPLNYFSFHCNISIKFTETYWTDFISSFLLDSQLV